MENTMKKIISAALIAATLIPSIAHADDWRHRGYGGRPGYGGGGN